MSILSHVSTRQAFDKLQKQHTKKHTKLSTTISTLSTGYKAEQWGDAPRDTKLVLSAAADRERNASFKALNDRTLSSELKPYELALETLNYVLKEFYVLCKNANNAAVDSTRNFPQRLSQLQDQFITQLNAKDTLGNYIFSGIRTRVKPVDMSNYPTDFSLEPQIEDPNNPGTLIDNPDYLERRTYFGYYQGSDETLDIKLRDQLDRHDFRIKADHPAFEKTLRAFEGAKLIDLGIPQNAHHFEPVENVLIDALKQLNDELVINTGNSQQIIMDVNEGLTKAIDIAKNTWGETSGQDILEGLQNYQLLKVSTMINDELTFNTIKFLQDFLRSVRLG